MKKIILSCISLALSANVFAQSTLITPGNQENKNSGPDLILTSNGVPELRGQRSGGTIAAPTSTLSGSNLLQINGYGHNGTSFVQSSQLRFLTTENWSTTARGTDMAFSTTKLGTNLMTEKMRITGDGNVGIGTSAPLTTLNIAGGNWDLATTNGDFAIGNSTYKLKFGVATGGGGAGDARIYTTGGTHRTIFGSNATDIMTVSETGVGIGTITPLRDFVVTGATPSLLIGYNSSSLASNNVESGRLYFDEAVNGTGRCGFELHYDGSANRLNFNSICTSPISRLSILRDNGNVGIGVLNPVNKLEVNGVIRANEVIVETGWADYVFQDDYKLKPLSEVEAFIKANKHLPSLPSAAKIQEKGAHMAELMTKMMEKIEELTLYSIEQKKEIDELKRRLDEKK